MEIFADYHTHTIYSHGKGTIEENVKAAINKGLKEIVISDHGPSHLTYGVKASNLPLMRAEIDKLKLKYPEISILLGIEANIISTSGDLDVSEEALGLVDKLLAGFHFGAAPKDFNSACKLYGRYYLSKVVQGMNKNNIEINTKAMVNAINKYKIDIITHPGAKLSVDISTVAKAAAKRGTALEINSSHGHLNLQELKIAMKEEVNFVIDSDAHTPENVGNVVKGILVAIDAGLPIDRILNVKKI